MSCKFCKKYTEAKNIVRESNKRNKQDRIHAYIKAGLIILYRKERMLKSIHRYGSQFELNYCPSCGFPLNKKMLERS